jgi:hypothetical protein
MKLIVKYFFLVDFYFWGVVLDLDKYIFCWQTCFIWGVILGWSHLGFREIQYLDLRVDRNHKVAVHGMPLFCVKSAN